MQLLYDVLLVLHIISWAIVIGGWLTHLRPPQFSTGIVHGAGSALLTGVLMVGIASASDSVTDPNHTKIGVKLVVAAIILVLAVIAQRKSDEPRPALLHGVGALALVNVCIAVLWT